jgi:hypothetical protein
MTCRQLIIICFSIIIHMGCNSQPASPYSLEEGAYSGSNNMSSGTVTLTYKPIFGTQVTPVFVNTSEPSPYGDMIIKVTGANKGTYSFINEKSFSGDWNYNPAKDQLLFTGKLKDALQAYKVTKDYYSLTFHIRFGPNTKDYKQFIYTKKTNQPKPARPKPNGDLIGTITIMQGKSTTVLLDVATGKTGKSFSGGMASTNSSMNTVTLSPTGDAYHMQVAFYDKQGKAVTWTSQNVVSYKWPIDTYQLAVLDQLQTRIALIGSMYTGASYPSFPFDYKIAVIDTKNGAPLGTLKVEQQRYIKPAFFKDGRLLYSPADGGIAISNQQYNNHQKIYNNVIGGIALSPDEKTIVFNEGTMFYSMHIDGSNKQQIICNGEALSVNDAKAVSDMSFSPDGKYVGITYGYGPSYYIIVFPLNGGQSTFIKDAYGEDLVQNNPVMSWN